MKLLRRIKGISFRSAVRKGLVASLFMSGTLMLLPGQTTTISELPAIDSGDLGATVVIPVVDPEEVLAADRNKKLPFATLQSVIEAALTASDVGLGNVDNTSDANKPVSTATQTALALKLNLSGGEMSGSLDLDGHELIDGVLTGGSLMDAFDANSQKITSLANGTASGDAVNKGQLDAAAAAITASSLGLGNVDNTADADKPVSDATAAAIAAIDKPIYRPATQGYGFADLDATAAISAAGVTDDQAESHYHQIIGLIKSLRCWDDFSNGYLLGSKWQDSSTTPKSLTGANNGSGTSTYGNWSATFNGTSDKYLFANGDASTSSSGRCFICVYKHNGVKQPAMLVSNYAGGTTKGMSLSVAGSSLGSTGAGLLDDAFLYASADGSTNTVDMTLTGTVDTDWSIAVANHRDGWIELWNNRTNPTRAALSTQWINNTNHSIGSTPNGAYFFAGEIAFAAEFTAGLEAWQVSGLIRGIERILGDVLPLTNEVIFEGNSLTASAPDGGTTYPAQLMALAGWSDLRWANMAEDGAKQIQNIEGQFDWQIARHAPRWNGQDSLLVFWSGINDITAGTTATAIIASMERYLVRAKAAGFRVALLTLTPVADTGDGLSYGYGPTQQGYITTVNEWIRSTPLADTVVDLDEIGDANPEFLDPTDTTYYVSGDGLHHNNAGRALIAAKVAAEVTEPE